MELLNLPNYIIVLCHNVRTFTTNKLVSSYLLSITNTHSQSPKIIINVSRIKVNMLRVANFTFGNLLHIINARCANEE